MKIKSEVIVKDSGPMRQLYQLSDDTDLIILIGGRGGRKTYEVSKFVAYSSTIKAKRCVILRDEKEKVRESILNEIFLRYDTANKYGHLDKFYDKLESGIRNKKTGAMMVFTQGFRASSNDKKSNLKGVSDVDLAVVEEAEDIRIPTKFNTFRDSIRKKGSKTIVMLNTPDVNHWIVKKYFNLVPVLNDQGVATGYFKLVPKEIKGFKGIITTYKDNPYLSEDVVRRYESYGDPASPDYDLHYYYTEILGYASTGRKGQIFTKCKPIKFADYVALEYKEIFGLDFGTARPAGLVGCKFHQDVLYTRQLNYLPKDTLGIGIMLCQLGFTQKELIIADSAVPLEIFKLNSGWSKKELTPEQIEKFPQLLKGFHVMPAIKGPGSIESGISLLKGLNWYIVEESEDFWKETREYIWDTDRNGNPTGQPVDDNNHLIDPTRYVATARGIYY